MESGSSITVVVIIIIITFTIVIIVVVTIIVITVVIIILIEHCWHMLQVAAQAACTSTMQASHLAHTQLAHRPPTSAGWRCTQTPLACGVWKTHSLHAPPLRCCLFLIDLVVIGILYMAYLI